MGFIGKAASVRPLFFHPLALQVYDDLAEGREASGQQLGVKGCDRLVPQRVHCQLKKGFRQSTAFNL